MNNWINTILPLICISLSLRNLIKYARHKYRMSLIGILPVIYFTSFLLVSVLFLLMNFELFPLMNNVVFFAAIGLLFGTYVTVFILSFLKEWEDKKIRVLLRIPVIILLLFQFLKDDRVYYLLILNELVMLYLSYQKREINPYAARLQIKQALFVPLILIAAITKNPVFLILYLIITFVFKSAVLNAIVIKNIMYKKQQNMALND